MSVTVKDVYDYINIIAPFDTQEEWDNGGFLVGDIKSGVRTVGFTLDITKQTIQQALTEGVDLIVSHHPVIFSPQKNFISGNPAYEMAKHSINAICAHTSLDSADGGVNDVLLNHLGLKPVIIEGINPMLRTALVEEMAPKDFANFVAEKLKTPVRYVDGEKLIKTVAVCGGAGGKFIGEISNAGIDAYITGEAKHNELLDAQSVGLTTVIAGHFETENLILPIIANKIAEAFPSLKTVIIKQENPIKYIK